MVGSSRGVGMGRKGRKALFNAGTGLRTSPHSGEERRTGAGAGAGDDGVTVTAVSTYARALRMAGRGRRKAELPLAVPIYRSLHVLMLRALSGC